ncbi:MAG: SlyX family protein [Gammaproteobacteria bacterium]
MSDERLEQIEIKLAYQDDALRQLSDVVYRQQQQIELLRNHCQRLDERMTNAGSAAAPASAEDEKPPHY